MSISQLTINQFRNIEAAALTPAGGLNLIYGANGSGKTSVLEAIWFLGLGRSFRSNQAQRVIQYEQEQLTLFCRIGEQDKVGLRRTRQGDVTIKVNGDKPEKVAELAKLLPLQLITPESFALLLDGPKARREYIDWGAFHSDPHFHLIWARSRRLLKQRNQLLRAQADDRQIAIWDQQFAHYSNELTERRRAWVNSLNGVLEGIIGKFLPNAQVRVSFSQGWDSKTPIEQILKQQLQRDKQLGYTVSGPHKADLRLRVNNIPVQDVLSRGQLKLLVCALKIAQGVLLSQQHRKQCIYLVDDLASELDSEKRTLLLQQLEQTGSQVFVTAIDPEQLAMISWQRMFHVEQGRINTTDS
ncbi:DNA replication/repair protein RecF [Ferrimonas aestuarii]|uniref:DNA replication and repair protein RecF n=1 Tax=Ferrimonas aestuarii TaxID=2569539 RepID=A0A4U1BK71_9GAMM|nr:DNA replication/repair protein RecF [Ferrimonas aestuarii]TKB51897.1 DNA replication/repair protein RecF [Ferrimonas aestuarii]